MRTNILTLFVLISPIVSQAADTLDIKPGLWDVTSTIQMSGLPPIPNLDQMSPEQRARIEGAMKNMAASPRSNTVKSCITREGIEKEIAKANSNQNNRCAPKLVSASSSKVEVHIECTQEKGDMKSNGDMTIERKDSEHFTGNGAMKTSGANGRSMDMKWSMTGVFVSSDCGNVKPMGQ